MRQYWTFRRGPVCCASWNTGWGPACDPYVQRNASAGSSRSWNSGRSAVEFEFERRHNRRWRPRTPIGGKDFSRSQRRRTRGVDHRRNFCSWNARRAISTGWDGRGSQRRKSDSQRFARGERAHTRSRSAECDGVRRLESTTSAPPRDQKSRSSCRSRTEGNPGGRSGR